MAARCASATSGCVRCDPRPRRGPTSSHRFTAGGRRTARLPVRTWLDGEWSGPCTSRRRFDLSQNIRRRHQHGGGFPHASSEDTGAWYELGDGSQQEPEHGHGRQPKRQVNHALQSRPRHRRKPGGRLSLNPCRPGAEIVVRSPHARLPLARVTPDHERNVTRRTATGRVAGARGRVAGPVSAEVGRTPSGHRRAACAGWWRRSHPATPPWARWSAAKCRPPSIPGARPAPFGRSR